MSWYAKNVAGTTNNQVTVSWNTTHGFGGVSVLEFSGLDQTSPLDASASAQANATSVTTSAFTTAQANEVAILGSVVEAITQTWCASDCTGYTGADAN